MPANDPSYISKGLVCALLLHGVDPDSAMEQVSAARGLTVPETEAQREWIARFATF